MREWLFADDIQRRWRFDLAWPSFRVAVEIDGFGPGHYSKHGRAQDNYKANAAAMRGWYILRYSTEDLRINPCRILEEIAWTLRQRIFRDEWGFCCVPPLSAFTARDWPKASQRKQSQPKKTKGRRR